MSVCLVSAEWLVGSLDFGTGGSVSGSGWGQGRVCKVGAASANEIKSRVLVTMLNASTRMLP